MRGELFSGSCVRVFIVLTASQIDMPTQLPPDCGSLWSKPPACRHSLVVSGHIAGVGCAGEELAVRIQIGDTDAPAICEILSQLCAPAGGSDGARGTDSVR